MKRDIPLGIGSAPSSKETMTHPPNSYCRVTFYVASVLASSTEPQRLNTGEIEATWTDNRHRRLHLNRCNHSMGGGAVINSGHSI
jgi:hypothetical protein